MKDFSYHLHGIAEYYVGAPVPKGESISYYLALIDDALNSGGGGGSGGTTEPGDALYRAKNTDPAPRGFHSVDLQATPSTAGRVPASYGVILGGDNCMAGFCAIGGGGRDNIAGGNYDVVIGGIGNRSHDEFSVLIGGTYNHAQNEHTVIIGGTHNVVSGDGGAIIGGNGNEAGDHAFVALGAQVTAENGCIALGGGGNTLSRDGGFMAQGLNADIIGSHSMLFGAQGNGSLVAANFSVGFFLGNVLGGVVESTAHESFTVMNGDFTVTESGTFNIISLTPVLHAAPSAPASAALLASTISPWLDEASNELVFAVRYSDGSLHEARVAVV